MSNISLKYMIIRLRNNAPKTGASKGERNKFNVALCKVIAQATGEDRREAIQLFFEVNCSLIRFLAYKHIKYMRYNIGSEKDAEYAEEAEAALNLTFTKTFMANTYNGVFDGLFIWQIISEAKREYYETVKPGGISGVSYTTALKMAKEGKVINICSYGSPEHLAADNSGSEKGLQFSDFDAGLNNDSMRELLITAFRIADEKGMLKPAEKAIFMVHHIGGKSLRQIAIERNIRENTLQKKDQRLRKKLLSIILEQDPEALVYLLSA